MLLSALPEGQIGRSAGTGEFAGEVEECGEGRQGQGSGKTGSFSKTGNDGISHPKS